MKVSEITVSEISEYLKLDGQNDGGMLTTILQAAKAFIRSYTGLKEEEMDEHADFWIVVMLLCQDMYDNRALQVDKNNLNKTVDTVLGMHCVNLV